jgi:hypothetical protein
MEAPAHLRLFNPQHGVEDTPTFHAFVQLPAELRLKIWQHAVARPRFINVGLTGLTAAGLEAAKLSMESYQQWLEDGDRSYTILIEGYRTTSRFLRVNREARKAALEFYRVRIPCTLCEKVNDSLDTELLPSSRPDTFLFNPEYDTLRLHCYEPARGSFAAFFHDLKATHDPRGVGLLNVALSRNDITRIHYDSSNVTLQTPEFHTTIKQLQVIYIVLEHSFGRTNFGFMSNVVEDEFFFNRSLPIKAKTPNITILPRDPRAIELDLKRLHLAGLEPREIFQQWSDLLAKWHLTPDAAICKFLFMFDPHGDIKSRDDASGWVSKEDNVWNNPDIPAWKIRYPAEDLQDAVKPAFGFWIVPAETFGPIHERRQSTEGSKLWDISSHWPMLALFDLS